MKTKAISILFFLTVYLSSSFAQISPNSDQLSAYQQLNEKYQNGIKINWHKTNGSPEIVSFDIPVAFGNNQKESASQFLKEIKKLLDYRTNKDTLILLRTNENKGRKYFRFQQWYKGVRVKDGEYVVTVLQDGKVKTALGSFYKDINVDTNPQISSGEALQTALKNPPKGKNLKNLALSSELIIYTKENINYLAYELHVAGEWEGESWRYIIDASNSNVLELSDDVMHTSQANVYLRHPGLDASYTTISPLPNLSGNGYLQGTYANILNEDVSRAYNANNDFRYSTGDTHFDEANLYYHVDKIAAYFRGFGFDEFTQITAHAHYGSYSFHTGYNPNDHHIRFTDEQVTDYHSAAREDKVIYHEYTHAVSDYIAGLSSTHDETGAINEGNSDYFAGSFTGRSLINEYFSYIEEINQRDMTDPRIADFTEYNNDDYYWVDGEYWGYHEPHFGGELWSACLWDIRDDLGPTAADEIIYDGLYAIPSNSTFLQYRKAILDADIFDYNGSHLNTIAHNFYLRGIGNDVQTVSGTLQSSQTWSQYVQLSGNVYVPSGKTLTIASTATVNLLNGGSCYSIISTGGTITKQAGATINGLRARLEANTVLKGLCSTIQTAANYLNNHNEIRLEDGDFNENVSIYNKSDLVLSGGSSYYTHFGNLTLNNCDWLYGYNFGAKQIHFNSADYTLISGIGAYGTDQSTIGFYFYNSDVSSSYLVATYSQAGVTCTDGTEADIDDSWLYDNLRGVDSYNGSNVSVYSTYFCGTALDLKTYNFSSIEAISCYFDGGTPSTSGSGIQHTGDNSCPLSKVNPNQQPENNNYVTSTNEANIGSEFERINSVYFDINKRLVSAFNTKSAFNRESYCTEYDKVIEDFKEFIRNNPDSPLAKIALIASAKSYRRMDDLRGKSDFAGMKNFLTDVIENKEYSSLKPQAERLMIDYYRLTNDFTTAIKTADNIIEKYQADTSYICGAMYAKGLILAHNLNQPEKAAECFSLILQKYPENVLADLAENELEILGVDPGKIVKEKSTVNNNLGFSTSSYPNPFNPVTVIKYSLPTDEKVTIKVYDILGRETAVLVNEYKTAGEYSVNFDGSNLASGVYFYSFTAGKFNQVKKIVLAK